MTDNLKFKVSAELKNILGRDLITSPDIAILELVKNSYDAHATKVDITFDGDYLSIADNGKGMSMRDLLEKWLLVAYSAKSDGTEDSSYRDKFKRHYAGAKGIGRLSCDRLAANLVLTTRSAEENTTEVLYVDWSSFEHNPRAEFDTIDIPHETLDTIPAFPGAASTGTILEFSHLHSIWTREDIIRLRKSLEKMINPFSNTDDDFQIEIFAPQMEQEDHNKVPTEKVNGLIENTISDVLKLKTTEIESHISNGFIHTTLTDRGVVMYEIEERDQDFLMLESASVNLFFLNRAAKYSFTAKMGVQPVNYGNVFLFRNGFRILPFGEFNDDSWGLNKRLQQGYKRRISTRDLLGRVNIETDDPNLIKEVTSRDGGLIKTAASQQLMEYFMSVCKRLERYVSGVLWGEGFLRKEYFVDQASAIAARKQLAGDKDYDSTELLYENIGSKVDYLQLIKALVNDKRITLIRYNEDLANIVANPTETEVIQAQIFEDVRKVAESTNDSYLLARIQEFEKHVEVLRRQKEEAVIREEEARKEAEEARKEAEEANIKAREEEEKRKTTEAELEQKNKQNLFLLSIGTLDNDRIIKYHHDIRIHSATIHNTVGQLLNKLSKGPLTRDEAAKYIERISRANDKIASIAQFATKANYSTDADVISADIVSFIAQYVNNVLPEFYSDLSLRCVVNSCSKTIDFAPLEASIFIDNMVSNAAKFNAKHFNIVFENSSELVCMTVSNDGEGLSSKITTPNSIFEKGFTTTNGSGLGLYNVASFVRKVLKGTIEIETNPANTGFKLLIKF